MKKYDEMSVVQALSKNPDVRISHPYRGAKVIEVVRGSQYCGNGTWGKIDFLVKHCGFVQVFISINAQIVAKQAEKEAKKQAVKEAKAAKKNVADDMAKNVKKVMKMRK